MSARAGDRVLIFDPLPPFERSLLETKKVDFYATTRIPGRRRRCNCDFASSRFADRRRGRRRRAAAIFRVANLPYEERSQAKNRERLFGARGFAGLEEDRPWSYWRVHRTRFDRDEHDCDGGDPRRAGDDGRCTAPGG